MSECVRAVGLWLYGKGWFGAPLVQTPLMWAGLIRAPLVQTPLVWARLVWVRLG
jgi:hypothetical protein